MFTFCNDAWVHSLQSIETHKLAEELLDWFRQDWWKGVPRHYRTVTKLQSQHKIREQNLDLYLQDHHTVEAGKVKAECRGMTPGKVRADIFLFFLDFFVLLPHPCWAHTTGISKFGYHHEVRRQFEAWSGDKDHQIQFLAALWRLFKREEIVPDTSPGSKIYKYQGYANQINSLDGSIMRPTTLVHLRRLRHYPTSFNLMEHHLPI